MKPFLKPLLAPTRDSADLCISAFADDQFLRIHESLKSFNRFSGWMLLMSGAIIGMIASNYDKLGSGFPISVVFLKLLAWSVGLGTGAKILFVFADFMMARVGTVGSEGLKWIVDKEMEFRALLDAWEDKDQSVRAKLTERAMYREYHTRLPWIMRIGGLKGVEFGREDRIKFFRLQTSILLLAGLLIVGQMVTMSLGVITEARAISNYLTRVERPLKAM